MKTKSMKPVGPIQAPRRPNAFAIRCQCCRQRVWSKGALGEYELSTVTEFEITDDAIVRSEPEGIWSKVAEMPEGVWEIMLAAVGTTGLAFAILRVLGLM